MNILAKIFFLLQTVLIMDGILWCHQIKPPFGHDRWILGSSEGQVQRPADGRGLFGDSSPALNRLEGDWAH